MKRLDVTCLFAALLATGTVWAYGGGGSSSTKACAKPKFNDFVPAENAEAATGSAFSFNASANTFPDSIKVSVKGQSTSVKVTQKAAGDFAVSGTLPSTVKGDYARIAINAEAQGRCKGSGGWLVKIKP